MMREVTVLDSEGVKTAFQKLAADISETHPGKPLALVGIYTRGVGVANRLVRELAPRHPDLARGTLDISLYRDDLDNLAALPTIEGSELPFKVEGSTIVLCDDVLFTGRTIRAALDVLLDYGRPAKIELAVLADRGHRELPVAATYRGITVSTRREDYLRVHLKENDGEDRIIHYQPESP